MGELRLPTETDPAVIINGDCRAVLPALPDAFADAVITDPPYPGIVREYGTWTEAEWFDLMDVVVRECRRILRPTGSAVFILQPNSERVGKMRTWLWEFMAKWGREWGIVQDVWWWNLGAIPLTKNDPEALRGSLKACVWLGMAGCHRDATGILWAESDSNKSHRASERAMARIERTQETRVNVVCARSRTAVLGRGGTQPFNVIPLTPDTEPATGHGARTPLALARWWVRYICPPGGTVADPFVGSGTTALACLAERRRCLGIEREPQYAAIAERRLAEPLGVGGLFGPDEVPVSESPTLFE